MPFMQRQTTNAGKLASIDCGKCGQTIHWHEWVHDGQAEDLKTTRCPECGGEPDPDTYWESESQTWFAGRFAAPGYMDCTDWDYSEDLNALEADLEEMYGEA